MSVEQEQIAQQEQQEQQQIARQEQEQIAQQPEPDGYSQCAYCRKFKTRDQFEIKTSGHRKLSCIECCVKKRNFYRNSDETARCVIRESDGVLDPEIWKIHPRFTTLAANSTGIIIKVNTWRVQGSLCPHGYIKLRVKYDEHYIYPYAHRIVYECFHGLIADDDPREICHNDSNRMNNAIDNLRLDTHQANMADRVAARTLQTRNRIFPERNAGPIPVKARVERPIGRRRIWTCYSCAAEASEALGVSIADIYDSANNLGRIAHGGYVFRFNRSR